MIKNCKCDPYYTCKTCRKVTTYTYAQIGDLLGISHQAVCEIEKRAIQKLRNNLQLLGYNKLRDLL